MLFKQIDKKIVLKPEEIFKLQILLYCHFNKIYLSKSELECASFLATYKDGVSLTDFCNAAYDIDISSSPQYARNIVKKIIDKKIAFKKGENKKKKLFITKSIEIYNDENIILNLKAIAIDETREV